MDFRVPFHGLSLACGYVLDPFVGIGALWLSSLAYFLIRSWWWGVVPHELHDFHSLDMPSAFGTYIAYYVQLCCFGSDVMGYYALLFFVGI